MLTNLYVCVCVYESVAPLSPSSLARLLSCEERFLLAFGIRGNTSFHDEPSVYGDHLAPPTPHSSPFPYITLSSATSPIFFFLPLACISCISVYNSKHLTALLYMSSRPLYFVCIVSADLLLCNLSLLQSRPLLRLSNKTPLHIYLVAFYCSGLLSFLELTHLSVCFMCLFFPAELP